jgi:hypothetical protein
VTHGNSISVLQLVMTRVVPFEEIYVVKFASDSAGVSIEIIECIFMFGWFE